MKITVRLDDITPGMDWQCFYRFKALLDQYQVKPLIGIIPDCRDPKLSREVNTCGMLPPADFWGYIRSLQADGWTVALHGWHHVYDTDQGGLFPLNNFSEFAGHTFEEQEQRIADGKRILKEHGIDTDIFMAPAHSYDRNTLRALKANGFTKVTDGIGTQPYTWKGLTFYPISFRLSNTLKKKDGYSTMVVHTDTTSDEKFDIYQKYFEMEGPEWIPYSAYLQVSARPRGIFGRAREFLMAKLKFLLVRFYHLLKKTIFKGGADAALAVK